MKVIKVVLSGYTYYKVALLTLCSLSIFSTSTSVNAQKAPYFSCKNKQGIWTTVVATKQGEANLIKWDSAYFHPSNYTPETRCNQVTGRLNTYSNGTSELYISSGRMNNQPVICITNNHGGSCQKLLFTLKPGQDGEKVIDLLIGQTESNSNLSPFYVGTSPCHTYLSLNALLGDKTKAKKICNYRSSNPARKSRDSVRGLPLMPLRE